ncbi:hypothetical protein JCM10450v2_002685 [Rhodotorula kratochvilovae]
MAHGYGAPPATPPRGHASRSSSISTQASPISTRQQLTYRLSPRKRSAELRVPDGTRSLARVGAAQVRGASPLDRLRWLARRQWRVLALAALAISTMVLLYASRPGRPPLVIPKRPYTLHDYKHLDYTAPITLQPDTRILHVTKEFGPATMGGLGVMLTALSIAQSNSPHLSISVALPHYSYLRELYPASDVQPFANLSVPFTTNPSTGRVRPVHCHVSLLRWRYAPAPDFLDPHAPLERTAEQQRSIDVYLIGPGDERPFSAAFRAKDEGDIYSAYKPLKQEWKDLYFARAAAELVGYLGAKDPATVFEDDDRPLDADDIATPSSARRSVDVVHLHGATNAMVAHHLREREREERSEPHLAGRTPAIVYTLHDSLDEVEYSDLVSNVAHFVSPPAAGDALAPLRPYIYRAGTQLFTSALGVDLADMVTFVSRSIAADIVAGRFRFHLEDLVMPSIAARAGRGEFIGVTNGLDFTERSRNPFTNDKLVEHELAFPRVGADLLDPATFGSSSFSAVKDRARAFVVAELPQLFSREGVGRPWLLFVGRYQYNKGCQLFSTLLEVLASPTVDGRLILLGAHNNYPFAELTRLAKQYPRHLTLIDDRTPSTSSLQATWGAHLRLASDIAFVPSLSEAFGLVAAEALLFGMPVLSTGVGGLREFLVPAPHPRANGYLFDLFPHWRVRGGVESAAQGAEEDYSQAAHDVRPGEAQLAPARAELRRAAEDALRDWRARRDGDERERERFTRRMVADALKLKWDRERGPVEEYIRVYSEALARRRRRLRLPGSLPPSAEPPRVTEPATPQIAHGGHDAVSGIAGVEHLPRSGQNEVEGRTGDEPGLGASLGGAGRGGLSEVSAGAGVAGVLPVVKVWSGGAEEQVRLAAEAQRAKQEAKRAARRAAAERAKGAPGLQERLRRIIGGD